MIDINLPNFITIGLISALFAAGLTMLLTAMGWDTSWITG